MRKLKHCLEGEAVCKLVTVVLTNMSWHTTPVHQLLFQVQRFSPKKNASSSKRVITASSDENLSKEMKTKMYAITRNANKRLKRQEALISEQKECI